MSVQDDLARCDREIAEIRNRPDVLDGSTPAWLATLGILDWEYEKRLVADEALREIERRLEGTYGW